MKAVGSRRILLLALALDLAFGEPPSRLHPVVGIGRYLNWARRQWRGRTPAAQFAEGATCWGLGAAGSFTAGLLAARLPWWAQALALKPLFSARALFAAVRSVQAALLKEEVEEARRLLGWHLVSRPTHDMSASEVSGAAIESLFENLSDSLVAPLLAYRLGGLPLAAVYRFANTADAAWGYHSADLEWPGKTAARTDDLLNLLPARLTGGLVVLAAGPSGGSLSGAWTTLSRDAHRTTSPNAGYPMAAAAGALGLRLEKRGQYGLGDGRAAAPPDLERALKLARTTGLLALLVLMLPLRFQHA